VNFKAVVKYPSIGIVFVGDKGRSTLCVSGAQMQNSKQSIIIVFVGDKGQHLNICIINIIINLSNFMDTSRTAKMNLLYSRFSRTPGNPDYL